MELTYRDELYHHGIKGQRWGVRRYQNPDGTRTNAGKSRYSRGKQYSEEESKIKDEEYWRQRDNSKKYQKIEKEAYRIANKYGLDQDDGGGGDHTRFTDEQLKNAGQRYWNLSEDMAALDEEFYEKAEKYAREQIIKKHGDTAISDIKHYERTQNGMVAAALIALLGGYAWLVSR